ncbi:MAG: hypothetical protein IJ391_03870, partial [Clostridia bacterium]|nr:hypothetical protein [Clostridia bacterium]
WADGFHFGIKYWEIWNEPDNDNGTDVNENPMWNGTMEDYFKLYEAASKHLKNCFGGNINVGGYASCGFWALLDNFGGIGETRSKYFVTFFEKFFAYVKENNCPIDFFSWHSYASTAETEIMADFIDEKLYEYGYAGLETHLNEWNNAHSRKYHGSVTSAARYAAMMCAQQNKKTYMLNFYDARIGIGDYAGMFSPLTYEPYVCYQSFKAFNELYKLGDQVKLTHDADGLYAIAASNGSDRAVLIANETENSCELTLPACKGMSVYTIDEDHSLEKSDADPTRLTVYKESVILLK